MPEASSVSRSTRMGSSVKNFGAAADPSAVAAASAATVLAMAAEIRVMVVMMNPCLGASWVRNSG